MAGGGTVLDPLVVKQLMGRRRDPLAGLTPREREVLALMAEGRSNAAIAEALVVTLGAVEKHTQRIFAKLGLSPDDDSAHRRVLAVVRYLRSGSRTRRSARRTSAIWRMIASVCACGTSGLSRSPSRRQRPTSAISLP